MKEKITDWNCNVIRDLMPSYLDDICSKESRYLVDAHLISCEQCRAHMELLKNVELTDEQGEECRVSCLKKVKRHYASRERISLILFALTVMIGYCLMIEYYGMIKSNLFYLIFPLFFYAAYSLLPERISTAGASKTSVFSWILIAASALLVLFYFVLAFLGVTIVRTQSGLFGIPLNRTGPYLGSLLTLTAALQLGIFVLAYALLFCGRRIHKSVCGLPLTGIALSAGYQCILHSMSTAEAFCGLLCKVTVCIALEGMLFTALICCFAKNK